MFDVQYINSLARKKATRSDFKLIKLLSNQNLNIQLWLKMISCYTFPVLLYGHIKESKAYHGLTR